MSPEEILRRTYKLKQPESRVLYVLLQYGPLSVSQLETATGYSRNTIAVVLSSLAKKNLVRIAGYMKISRKGPGRRIYEANREELEKHAQIFTRTLGELINTHLLHAQQARSGTEARPEWI